MAKIAGTVLLALAAMKVAGIVYLGIFGTDKTAFFVFKQALYVITFGLAGWGLIRSGK
jgi:hypothetical protein